MHCEGGAARGHDNWATMTMWWAVAAMVLYVTGFQVSSNEACQITRAHGMLAADCSKNDLREIPPDLSSSIEVLDLSNNKINDLTSDSFSRYTSLRFLYLGDNSFIYVDEGVFKPLQLLEVLELSTNNLPKIPYEVLELPNLRKLYFSHTGLNLDDPNVYKGAPISNSLKVLSLSQNRLKEFPPLWMVPQVEYLNMSQNKLETIKVTDLAPICRLKELDISHNKRLFNSDVDKCDCYLFNYWITQWSIRLEPPVTFDCANSESENCRNTTAYQEAMDIRAKCNRGVETFERQVTMKRTWVWIGVTAATILGAVLLIGLFLHCRNSSKRRINANNNNHVAREDVKVPIEQSSQLLQEL